MAVIDKTTYLTIAQAYDDAVAPLTDIAGYYLDAANTILLDDEMDVELDLLRPFYNAYLSAESVYTATPSNAVEAVRALQEHVVRRSGAATVGTWWTTAPDARNITTLTVLTGFVDISEAAGYTIVAP